MSVCAFTKFRFHIDVARKASRMSWQCKQLGPHIVTTMREVSRDAIQEARRCKREMNHV